MQNVPVNFFLDGKVELRPGDCREVIKAMPDASVDSVVTDPPYALVSIVKRFGGPNAAPAKDVYARGAAGFMGKQWDTGETAFAAEFWAEVLRVLKPGGHVVAFSGTRTYHRMVVAIEDAGFEIRDQIGWAFGSGFPKSHDVSKGIDKAAGVEREIVGKAKRTGKDAGTYGAMAGNNVLTKPSTPAAQEWSGWGTALKPAWEPICLARKPLIGTVAANVLEHGTGALNIDGCRVEAGDNPAKWEQPRGGIWATDSTATATITVSDKGRWPANLVHDGSDEVLAGFPETGAAKASNRGLQHSGRHGGLADIGGNIKEGTDTVRGIDDNGGSAARFFYTAKADAIDRLGSRHPTVKPVDLMQWLVRLVTPKGGLVLDPFAGSGSTGEAAWREGMRCVLIEREEEYQSDIRKRMSLAFSSNETRWRGSNLRKMTAREDDIFK